MDQENKETINYARESGKALLIIALLCYILSYIISPSSPFVNDGQLVKGYTATFAAATFMFIIYIVEKIPIRENKK